MPGAVGDVHGPRCAAVRHGEEQNPRARDLEKEPRVPAAVALPRYHILVRRRRRDVDPRGNREVLRRSEIERPVGRVARVDEVVDAVEAERVPQAPRSPRGRGPAPHRPVEAPERRVAGGRAGVLVEPVVEEEVRIDVVVGDRDGRARG